jgi:hypothetical protein
MMEEEDDTYSLHLRLNKELQVVDVGTAVNLLVARDIGTGGVIELVGEGTLDVDGRLGKEGLGDLLAESNGSDLTTMVRLAVELGGVDSGIGAAKGA